MKQPKMKWGRSILISLPFFAVTIFWQAYDYIVPLMLTQHYKLSTTVYSAIMSIDNVVALVFLPLFGILSDKIHGPLGRRSPLILLGTVGGLIGFLGMAAADAQQVAGKNTLILYMLCLLIAVFFMSLYRSPSAALVADCFIRPQRTKANAMLNFMGALAGVFFSIIGKRMIFAIDGVTIFTKCIYFAVLVMVIATALYFLLMRENRFVKQVQELNAKLGLVDDKTDASNQELTKLTAEEKKSMFFILAAVAMIYMGYNGYNTHYTNYLVTYLQKPASWTTPYLLRILLAMFLMIPAAGIASKIGRRKSCIIGCIFLAVGYFGIFTVTPENANMLYVWGAISSIGFPLASINLGPMVLELGKDCDSGRYMGYYYIATTVAQIVTPVFCSLFINVFGYKIIGVYAAVFEILCLVCCVFVKHGDAKPILADAVSEAVAGDD
ncbi:MAG: MFS transporter [Faecalibacterium sp.]|nr:MFS transporter [Faecalibacterium sp.]